jgi:hypothetical protein
MATVSREIAKAARITELVREHLPTLLSVLTLHTLHHPGVLDRSTEPKE